MSTRIAFLFMIATWSLLPESAVADTDEWLVPQKQAQCLVDNLQLYRSSTSDPVVIFVGACPIVDPGEAIKSLQTNTALPSVREAQENLAIDEVIVYTLKELSCLSIDVIDTSGPIVSLPKVPCD